MKEQGERRYYHLILYKQKGSMNIYGLMCMCQKQLAVIATTIFLKLYYHLILNDNT